MKVNQVTWSWKMDMEKWCTPMQWIIYISREKCKPEGPALQRILLSHTPRIHSELSDSPVPATLIEISTQEGYKIESSQGTSNWDWD